MDIHDPDSLATCKNCGKQFTVGPRYWKRFCSSLCQKTWHKQEQDKARRMYREAMRKQNGEAGKTE